MIFLDRYALPVWLDKTPLVLRRLEQYAFRPVREPFAKVREEMEDIELTPTQSKRDEDERRRESYRERGRIGIKKQQAKMLEDMARLGETKEQRLRRQKLESQRRLRAERDAGKPAYSAKGNGARWRKVLEARA